MENAARRHALGIDWRIATGARSDGVIFFAYWLIASPFYLFGTSTPDNAWGSTLLYYLWMVGAYTTGAWVIANVIFPTFLARGRPLLAMVLLFVVLLIVSTGTYYVIDIHLFPSEDSWLEATLNYNLATDAQNLLTLCALLAGKKFYDEQRRVAALEFERRQSELQRLRAQVDPHFLFNALNILDVLIEDDAPEARRFVHRLSNLYRYLIRHRDEDLVPAADELAYARDYHYLVEQRFGASFRSREHVAAADLADRLIPPGSLQTALENVYKHNLATERNPVTLTLEVRGDALYVTNDFAPKPGRLATHERSGSGVANLLRRYALLTDAEVYARREDTQWVVRLPLLHLDSAPGAPHPERRTPNPEPRTPNPLP